MSIQPVPQLHSADTPDDFNSAVVSAQEIISKLDPLDYEGLHKEMSALNVPTTDNPSLQKLQEDIQRVQAAKDRMATIIISADAEFRTRNRCSDLLKESWMKFSSESAADKRKADATLRMSQFIQSAGQAEVLYKTAQRVMENLNDKQWSISRQVTIFQELIKLRDINRGLPEDAIRSVEGLDDSDLAGWEEQPN